MVMIVDGDGAKFRDEYIGNGDLGGGQAAHELKNRIKSYLRQKNSDTNTENWNIIVQFYANMDGLGKALAFRQILSSSLDLQKFASGFGRANSLFSFVDVGYGKDKADHKCREMLKVMLHVPSCRQVFFGPCQDNGYLTLLEEYRHDPTVKNKLTLFSAEPAEPGFVNLGLEIVSFPTVFRSEPLNNFSRPIPIGSHIKPVALGDSPTTPTPASNSAARLISSNPSDVFLDCVEDSPLSLDLTAPSPGSSVDTPSPASQTTWACVSRLSNAPIIDLYPKKLQPKSKYILLNAVNQRVDERLPPADSMAFRSIDNKSRSYSRNFCNFYHLNGQCTRGDKCEYQHDVAPKLSMGEKLALRHKSRQLPCGNGWWCLDISCINGHHCRYLYVGQSCCYGSTCFFKDTHEMDVVSFEVLGSSRCDEKWC